MFPKSDNWLYLFVFGRKRPLSFNWGHNKTKKAWCITLFKNEKIIRQFPPGIFPDTTSPDSKVMVRCKVRNGIFLVRDFYISAKYSLHTLFATRFGQKKSELCQNIEKWYRKFHPNLSGKLSFSFILLICRSQVTSKGTYILFLCQNTANRNNH